MTYIIISYLLKNDAPHPWGLYFQDSASPQMEGLVELHDNIMFYLIIIYFGVVYIMFSIIKNFNSINNKLTYILETGSQYTKTLPLALAIGLLFVYEFFTIIPFSFNNVEAISALLNLLTNLNELLLSSNFSSVNVVYNAVSPVIADTSFTNFLQVEAIGQGVYTYGAFWLIITSVILLLAMVAPIFISKK